MCGNVCEKNDGVIGSLEFALAAEMPPVLLVMGNSMNELVDYAVIHAMKAAGRSANEIPDKLPHKGPQMVDKLWVVHMLAPAAHDALLQEPNGSFAKLCELACKLNVWRTIELLLTSSAAINQAVTDGRLQVQGAYLVVETGKVMMLGEHPSKKLLLAECPSSDVIRTADDPPVPAEEALATMYAGNRRYCSGMGGLVTGTMDKQLLMQLSEGGQNPISVVLGCADSRAPIEILFDMRPGDLFVLRNAGNTCEATQGSLIGSAEYAIAHLRTKLLVVSGHTKCGAVTAAVDLIRNAVRRVRQERLSGEASLRSSTLSETEAPPSPGLHGRVKSLDHISLTEKLGSIGSVIAAIAEQAKQAVMSMPSATLEEQVKLATKLNVFATIEKMVQNSPLILEGVKRNEIELHGAIYDIFTGGTHYTHYGCTHQAIEYLVRHLRHLHRRGRVVGRTPSPRRGVRHRHAHAQLEGVAVRTRRAAAHQHPLAFRGVPCPAQGR